MHDALLHAVALHERFKQLCVETQAVRVVGELVAEVLIAGCTRRRNHSDAVQQTREGKVLVVEEDAFGFQGCDNLLASAGDGAQRVGGVDVNHVQRKAILLVKSHLHQRQNLHAVFQVFARSADEA